MTGDKVMAKLEEDYRKRKITDIGMLRALRAAGWGIRKLAEEFHCTEEVVEKTMGREGIK